MYEVASKLRYLLNISVKILSLRLLVPSRKSRLAIEDFYLLIRSKISFESLATLKVLQFLLLFLVLINLGLELFQIGLVLVVV